MGLEKLCKTSNIIRSAQEIIYVTWFRAADAHSSVPTQTFTLGHRIQAKRSAFKLYRVLRADFKAVGIKG